jgi:hypothetical protein
MKGAVAELTLNSRVGAPLIPFKEDNEFRSLGGARCSAALANELTSFLDTQDTSHPFQLPLWSSKDCCLFFLQSKGRICWISQAGIQYPASRMVRPIQAFVVNKGPICDSIEIMDVGLRELVRTASAMGMSYVDIRPEWTGPFAESVEKILTNTGWFPISSAGTSLRLDLSPTLDRLLASFRHSTRYEIRRSAAAGIKVSRAENEADLRDFLELYCSMAGERRFAAEDPTFLASLLQPLGTDPCRGAFFLARLNGQLRGGVLVMRAGKRCWYVLGATAKHQEVNAGHLLQWCAIQWAKQIGCREYDFCGYSEQRSSGPAFFKRGFCDRVVRFLPAHRYVLSPARYRVFGLLSRVRRAAARD